MSGAIKAIFLLTLDLLICVSGFVKLTEPSHIEFSSSYSKPERFILRSSVIFANYGNSTWLLTYEEKAVGLFMNNSWQSVAMINCSHSVKRVLVDEDGNLIGVLDLGNFVEPGLNVTYSVCYNFLSRPRNIPYLEEDESGVIDDIPKYLQDMFCSRALPWLVDENVKEVALDLADGETNVLRLVKRFVAWMWENIRYPSELHEVPYYPNETLRYREGDCDDQAILFVTFCRILGIPSYVQTGCIYLPSFQYNSTAWNGHLRNQLLRVGWHGWAVVYIPPWGWLPVDLTFVTGSLDDPVDAIRYSAASLVETIQYMNISRIDYVASARQYRDFLLKNDFYLFSRDEMVETFLGDLNCDFVVNIMDIALAAKAYGSSFSTPFWNGMADIAEPYGIIDIADVAGVAKEYGLKGR